MLSTGVAKVTPISDGYPKCAVAFEGRLASRARREPFQGALAAAFFSSPQTNGRSPDSCTNSR